MGHHHDHGADLSRDSLDRTFIIGIVINLLFVVVEVVAGWQYDSLALLSDAGHNFSDVLALLMALVAFKLLSIAPSSNYTYGYRRTTILAALANAILLLVAVGIIFWESIERIQQPSMVDGTVTAVVAGLGILVNGFTAWLFVKDKDQDLNVEGAYLHMLADTLVSVGVVLSGGLIALTQWYWIDTVTSWVIATIILLSTWRLFKDSLRLSLDGVPSGIEVAELIQEIEALPLVQSFHHVHVWGLSTVENALTAHLVVDTDCTFEQVATLKQSIKHQLLHKGIQHITLEIEREGETCGATACEVIQQGMDAHHHHHHHHHHH